MSLTRMELGHAPLKQQHATTRPDTRSCRAPSRIVAWLRKRSLGVRATTPERTDHKECRPNQKERRRLGHGIQANVVEIALQSARAEFNRDGLPVVRGRRHIRCCAIDKPP